ncbi:Protein IDA-LIKE 3 [Raphanus sativus]|uniref:Protein IDA-LIKE 3 n=1 Tax=Raphanus sativus TaxID=3726 RepID=A0A6J0K9L6_RAPSA|nr:protein IDA-LIKE 3 [Raphanus sativus]KAJ4883139.1 Protein IDA-LIKE 3 [Raphanus sativus]
MSSRNRRSRTNQLRRTILILGLLLVIFSCCSGARTTNMFSTSSPPKQADVVSPPHHHNHQVQDHKNVQVLGFLPRQFPVPASGPSRKHNDIGLSSTTRTPSP